MSHRSNDEITADWFRLITGYLIQVIEKRDEYPEDGRIGEEEVGYLIRLLLENSPAPDENVEEVPTPCRIEVWTGDGEPERSRSAEDWELQEEDEETGEIYPQGVRRLRLSGHPRRWASDDAIFYIDDVGPDWHHLEHFGRDIVSTLKRWLKRPELEVRRRLAPSMQGLVSLDLERLADDLAEANQAYRAFCVSQPEPEFYRHAGEHDGKSAAVRKRLGDIIDRLWLRLVDGDINRIDVSMEMRDWLRSLWNDVEWAQRWLEMTFIGPSPFVEADQEPGFLRRPAAIEFAIHLEVARWRLEPTKQDESGESKIRGPTANQLMMDLISKRPLEVIAWSATRWASEIGKGK